MYAYQFIAVEILLLNILHAINRIFVTLKQQSHAIAIVLTIVHPQRYGWL